MICSLEAKSVIVGGNRLEYYPSWLNAFSDELIIVWQQLPLMKIFTLCSLHHVTAYGFHIIEKRTWYLFVDSGFQRHQFIIFIARSNKCVTFLYKEVNELNE